MSPEQDIASRFAPDEKISAIRAHGHGLINDTFVATVDGGRRFILQRINRRVFPQPEHIMDNLRVLSEHARRHGGSGLRLPEILTTREGANHVVDAAGDFWRAQEFIENTRTLETITSVDQAAALGAALGRFHFLTHDLDPARLHRTLPGFHDAPGYFARFLRASARPRRHGAGRELLYALQFAETRRGLTRVLESARRAGRLVRRTIHGDTKLNNFLFNAAGDRVVSLIDLDTVQPGLVHYDIGDCLRSCANPAGEDPGGLESVHFDLDIARALLGGYLTEVGGLLTRHDLDHIYDAIRLIPFELGLRFLTDHLEGDRYFKIARPGQNLHRALAQFRLTAAIETSETALKALIAGLVAP